MKQPYSDQDPRTTGVYVDDVLVEQFDDNDLAEEKGAIERQRDAGKIYLERVVFGSGRVALRFETKQNA